MSQNWNLNGTFFQLTWVIFMQSKGYFLTFHDTLYYIFQKLKTKFVKMVSSEKKKYYLFCNTL